MDRLNGCCARTHTYSIHYSLSSVLSMCPVMVILSYSFLLVSCFLFCFSFFFHLSVLFLFSFGFFCLFFCGCVYFFFRGMFTNIHWPTFPANGNAVKSYNIRQREIYGLFHGIQSSMLLLVDTKWKNTFIYIIATDRIAVNGPTETETGLN